MKKFIILFIGLFSGVFSLDYIIEAEVKNDSFYNKIIELSSKENLKNILEIGSSNGEGSTAAFVKGISQNSNHPKLFCIEISKTRFAALKELYKSNSQVICYNVSSVELEFFPNKREITSFYQRENSKLKEYSIKDLLSWFEEDKSYLKRSKVCQNGIELVKKENDIEFFDMVLIDGCEFLGRPELDQVYGAKFILLDDIRTYKNWDNYYRLANDPNYTLVDQDIELRNGWAAFIKK